MLLTRDQLRELPKAHLHVHLEGAMRPGTLAEFCERDGHQAPTIGGCYGTFAAFQEVYMAARNSLKRPEDLRRLVTEVVEDAASDGAVWIEPAVHVPSLRAIGSDEEVMAVLLDASITATERTGLGVGWLLTVDRTRSPQEAVELAELATRYAGRGVIGLGLANDEAAAGPEVFAPAFAIAREAGLLSVPHAGEHGGADSVAGAVALLGADRIEHGIRATEDPEVLREAAAAGICFDVCPTSNVLLSIVDGIEAHPVRALLDAGIACSINADDPLLFGVGLLDEYATAHERIGLSATELAGCARNSIEHSAAPDALKSKTQGGIARWLDRVTDPAA